MKRTIVIRLLTVPLLFFLISSCDLFSKKNDECYSTMMAQQNPIIFLNFTLPDNLSAGNHLVTTGTKIVISGTIQKTYCDGSHGGNFSFSQTFQSTGGSLNYLCSGVNLDQPYQFKFDNELDYVLVLASLKVYFPDNTIYEDGGSIINKFYYPDIKLNTNTFEKYVILSGFDAIDWIQVSS